MTNEEKAREIENDIVFRENQPIYFMAIREAALKMAEWKDQQFKEYLEREKKKLNEGVKNFLEKGKADTALLYQTQIALINEIINELFGEDVTNQSDNDE